MFEPAGAFGATFGLAKLIRSGTSSPATPELVAAQLRAEFQLKSFRLTKRPPAKRRSEAETKRLQNSQGRKLLVPDEGPSGSASALV